VTAGQRRIELLLYKLDGQNDTEASSFDRRNGLRPHRNAPPPSGQERERGVTVMEEVVDEAYARS